MRSKTSRDRPKSAPYPRLKNSKRTSRCQFTVLENRKAKKNEPSGAPGPASASPWRAKAKKILEKKSHNAEKLKGGPFGGFSTSILSQNIKKWRGENFYFRKKNLTIPKKKLKGGTLWDFSTSILSQNSKKIERGPFGKFFFRKKSLAVPKKNWKGSRPVWYVTQENRKNLFGSVR